MSGFIRVRLIEVIGSSVMVGIPGPIFWRDYLVFRWRPPGTKVCIQVWDRGGDPGKRLSFGLPTSRRLLTYCSIFVYYASSICVYAIEDGDIFGQDACYYDGA